VPRTLRTYHESIELIAAKKADSLPPVLLVWSLDFWRDKHAWGESLIQHMQQSFLDLPASVVIFIESLDGEVAPGEGLFWVNLRSDMVKPPSGQQVDPADAAARRH
jgi:hypothetical protein